jgi:hypothetical protein
VASWKLIEPPRSFVASCQPNSALPVKFLNHKDLLCAQGTFCFWPRGITLIDSTQIRWLSTGSGGGGWSCRVIAQQRPRVSRLRLKGPFDYHSNEIVCSQDGQTGGQWAEIKGYAHRVSVNQTELGKKAARQKKNCN